MQITDVVSCCDILLDDHKKGIICQYPGEHVGRLLNKTLKINWF